MAVRRPWALSRRASWASSRASAEPLGRGRVKRLPGLSLGRSMRVFSGAQGRKDVQAKTKTPGSAGTGGVAALDFRMRPILTA